MSEKVAMPGDADEAGEKQKAGAKGPLSGMRSRRAKDEPDAPQSPADQTAAQQAKEEADAAEVFAKAQEKSEKAGEDERGPHSPAQHDDDGWGGLPVQMRG